MLVKKYANRRLYDTDKSRYITLDELAEAIRTGADPQVVDAKTQEDLTQSTLAQIILESRGASKLLPVPLLVQLIRMGDDALTEFFGGYMGWALGVYLQAKQHARTVASLNPFAAAGAAPFAGAGFGAPFFSGAPSWFGQGQGAPQPAPPPPVSPNPPTPEPPPPDPEPEDAPEDAPDDHGHASKNDLDALRRELEELKAAMRPKKR